MKRSLATDIGMARARKLVGRAWRLPPECVGQDGLAKVVIVGARLSLDCEPELLDDAGVWRKCQSVLDGEEIAR